MIRQLSSLLALLALASCASPGTTTREARPALWRVADADTTIYLFGTIHLLPPKLDWTTPQLDAALNASQGLVLETVLGDPAQLGGALAALAVSPGLPPLLERVPPAKRAKLAKVVTETGLSLATLDRLETWAAALQLASAGLAKTTAKTESGAEAQLSERFTAAGKPVAGLETPLEQLGYFDALPEGAQRQFLISIADDDADVQAQFDAMIAAWTAGDVARIAITFDEELRMSPELADALIRRRNANWAGWVTRRLDTPGTVFVAVGAGHLAGTGSLDALLEAQGLRVTRLQ